jgi:23S rRNA (cytosine1962-C5)-methyltransferase
VHPRFESLFPVWRDAWVVHEDQDLFVVDKPHGIPTHAPEPERVDDAHTRCLEFLHRRGEAKPYLGIHQRLDADTSGVLLFTRRKEANAGIAAELEGRRAEKTYLAAVQGTLADSGRLEHRLVPDKGGAMRVLPKNSKGGQLAVTTYKTIARKGKRALLEVKPETGRTHQIRVQLAEAGVPIAGDPIYAGPPAPRLLLHALELGIQHPSEKKRVTYRAPQPAAFEAWLRGEAHEVDLKDTARIEAVLRAASLLRYGIARRPGNDALRLVHGGGDRLSNVAVDLYGEHLVVSLGEEISSEDRERVLDAAHALGAAGIYLKVRPKHASVIVDARREEYSPKHAVRGEDAPDSFTVRENGLPYLVRLGDGLSTGIFLDQRDNRARVRDLSKGARVLNLFAYTGAFTVAAIGGGARATVTVDAAKNASAWAEENLDAACGEYGQDRSAHAIVQVDAFDYLRSAKKRGEKFDLVLLDPPSFATTKSSRFSAENDYPALAADALAVVAPGGRLLACTNHARIWPPRFRKMLFDAGRLAKVEIVQIRDLDPPDDFPPPPDAPPHLKSAIVRVA